MEIEAKLKREKYSRTNAKDRKVKHIKILNKIR